MHAYLLIGSNLTRQEEEIASISKKLNAKIYDYTIETIKDIRSLANYTKLKASKNVCILLRFVDTLSDISLNALLKQIEEPQEKIVYILTANSVQHVLPTIISRCQVIYVTNSNSTNIDKRSLGFPDLSTGQQLNAISKITKRDDALLFLEGLIQSLETKLRNSDSPSEIAHQLKKSVRAFDRIKKNGNITLQLTHLVAGN